MQVDTTSCLKNVGGVITRSLALLPIDILKGILGWIDESSVDGCMLRMTSSAIKWLLKNCMHWGDTICVHLPFNHPLVDIHHYLPVLTSELAVELKVTSLKYGNLANFKYLCRWEMEGEPILSYLRATIEFGHLDCLKSLLDMFKDKSLDMYYDELLALNCLYGHHEIAVLLFSLGANVFYRENLALRNAAFKGHIHIVSLLCIHGADIHHGWVIRDACRNGHLNVLVFLLALGVNLNAQPALTLACKHDHLDVVKLLCSVRTTTNPYASLALQEASGNGHLDIVKYLYSNETHTSKGCEYAVLAASTKGHLAVVQFLHSMNINVRSESDWPLRMACQYGHLDTAIFLASVGADIHAYNDYAIREACHNGHAKVVQYLYDHGARFNTSDSLFKGHLERAVEYGQLDMLQFFHTIESIPDNRDLLVFAVTYGNLEIVAWLHSIGLDIHHNDDEAIRTACQRGYLDIVKFLHSVGANIHARQDAPLLSACQFGHLDVVKFLHSVGANIHPDILGVLHRASQQGYLVVVDFLKSVITSSSQIQTHNVGDTTIPILSE